MVFDPNRHPKVFISYCHESTYHQDKILALAKTLLQDGIDVIFDQYVDGTPDVGWPRWMDKNIRNADYVLMICTELYYKRVMGDEELGIGLGVKWEGNLIYQHIYDNDSCNKKFLPCLLDGGHDNYIPTPLRGSTRYLIETEAGYESLYRYITGQPIIERPNLGKLRRLPSKERYNSFLTPLKKEEKLTSNLLEVSDHFKHVFIAETEYRPSTIKNLWKRLEELGGSFSSEWILKDKSIINVQDLRQFPWMEICDIGTVEKFDSSEWSFPKIKTNNVNLYGC